VQKWLEKDPKKHRATKSAALGKVNLQGEIKKGNLPTTNGMSFEEGGMFSKGEHAKEHCRVETREWVCSLPRGEKVLRREYQET